MTGIVGYPRVQYAVIQASRNKENPERLVIAYPDEKCLRSVIAASSIIELGFASREEATANMKQDMQDTTVSKQRPRTVPMFHKAQDNRHWQQRFGFLNLRGVRRVLQSSLSVVVLLFYSKNFLSTTIRMALGGSC